MDDDGDITGSGGDSLVERLLANGGDRHYVIDGHIGPAPRGRLRLYSSLALRDYVEMARSDVIEIENCSAERGSRAVVFFRREAELSYVQTMTIRAEQMLTATAAAAKAPCGCSGTSSTAEAAARQPTGGGGGGINTCVFCDVILSSCLDIQKLTGGSTAWCYLRYLWCLLTCGETGLRLR